MRHLLEFFQQRQSFECDWERNRNWGGTAVKTALFDSGSAHSQRDASAATSEPARAAGSWQAIAIFYCIACGFSWLAWSPLVLGPDGLRVLKTSVSFPVTVSIGTLGPFLACFIVHRWQTGRWKAIHLLPKKPLQWAWLLLGPLLILFCRCFLFSALITTGGPASWHWHIGALAGIWIPMFNYNLFGGPLFEEFGWRGFLQPRLQLRMPAWLAAVVTGLLWSTWHLPLFLVGWGGESFMLFLLTLICVSIVMAFAFNASGQSLVVAILMHSAFNAVNRFMPAFLGTVPTRQYPPETLLIALSSLLVAALLIAATRGRICAVAQ